jgi:eco57I restriction endonuclease
LKIFVDLKNYPVHAVLSKLLEDKTTGKSIIFATDSYADKGPDYTADSPMTVGAIAGIDPFVLQPRITKDIADRSARTKKRAEVFTPSWICNRMNNDCDEVWFGIRDVFNFERGTEWEANLEPIIFPKGTSWQDYVLSRRLEITCGEAPFLVSRYDTTSGDIILPIECRIGILDRKLRVVNENTTDEKTWMAWVIKAYQSTYGYEFQGDNLLIGRINLLNTFTDYLDARWHRMATLPELKKITNIIVWNLWQMDGLTGTVPFKAKRPKFEEMTLFDIDEPIEEEHKMIGCKIYDWVSNKSQSYESLKGIRY